MAVPIVEPLGASTLNRKWRLDVDAGTPETPDWVRVRALTEFQNAMEPQLQDDGDFDSEGYGSSTNTGINWSVTGKCARKTTVSDPTVYDAGQEILRLAGEEVGQENSVHVRFYEMTEGGPRTLAYEGHAAVTWSPDGGDKNALDLVSFTLTGQGKRNSIAHPDAGAINAPAWAATTAYVEGDRVTLAGGEILRALNDGTSGSTEPVAPGYGEVVVDGDIAWEQISA